MLMVSRRYVGFGGAALALSSTLGSVAIAGATATLAPTAAGATNNAWSAQSTPNRSGITNPKLESVDGVSESSCIAVGWGSTTSAAAAFSEYWNGST
jgi:hypothetical protein